MIDRSQTKKWITLAITEAKILSQFLVKMCAVCCINKSFTVTTRTQELEILLFNITIQVALASLLSACQVKLPYHGTLLLHTGNLMTIQF